jgi:hypothetical protein
MEIEKERSKPTIPASAPEGPIVNVSGLTAQEKNVPLKDDMK